MVTILVLEDDITLLVLEVSEGSQNLSGAN